MKKTVTIIIVLIIIVLAVGAGFYFGYDVGFEKSVTPNQNTSVNQDENGNLIRFTSETLNVDQPQIDEVITSPFTVTGEATGTWYFEASFPIEIISPDGIRLGQNFVQAQDDWMTEKLVPFEGEISFDPQGYTEGFLVFHKDNPSGLPEFDASLQIPVKFAQ